MSCERIDPKDFHSPAANQYTMNCLEELARSPKFKSYVRHIEYTERLYLTWFLAPFTLFGVLFFHVALFGDDGINLFMDPGMRPAKGFPTEEAAITAATMLLLLLAIPCVVIAPFVGFFEEPRRSKAFVTLLFLTAVNMTVAALGGSRLHYPPFLTTMPPATELVVSRHPAAVAKVLLVDVFVRRVLCLQGFLLAGYAVAAWRRGFWGRVWHPPLPVLTVPLAVGAFGVGWWVVVHTALPLFLTAEGQPTAVTAALRWSAVQSDPSGALGLCVTLVREVARQVYVNTRLALTSDRLPELLVGPAGLSLYLATASMALIHVLILLGKPIADFVVGAFLFMLPTDPTIWGLSLMATIGGGVALWRLDDQTTYGTTIAGLATLAWALLYNGFVA